MEYFRCNKPANRHEKRAIASELNRNGAYFEELEQRFLNILFDEKDIWSYDVLYTIYLNDWKVHLDYLVSKNKFKWTRPNLHFFEEKYKPIENERVS